MPWSTKLERVFAGTAGSRNESELKTQLRGKRKETKPADVRADMMSKVSKVEAGCWRYLFWGWCYFG